MCHATCNPLVPRHCSPSSPSSPPQPMFGDLTRGEYVRLVRGPRTQWFMAHDPVIDDILDAAYVHTFSHAPPDLASGEDDWLGVVKGEPRAALRDLLMEIDLAIVAGAGDDAALWEGWMAAAMQIKDEVRRLVRRCWRRRRFLRSRGGVVLSRAASRDEFVSCTNYFLTFVISSLSPESSRTDLSSPLPLADLFLPSPCPSPPLSPPLPEPGPHLPQASAEKRRLEFMSRRHPRVRVPSDLDAFLAPSMWAEAWAGCEEAQPVSGGGGASPWNVVDRHAQRRRAEMGWGMRQTGAVVALAKALICLEVSWGGEWGSVMPTGRLGIDVGRETCVDWDGRVSSHLSVWERGL